MPIVHYRNAPPWLAFAGKDTCSGICRPNWLASPGLIGRPWANTPTGETRTKIGQLLKEVGATDIARKHEINHPSDSGASVSVAHTAIRLGANGPVLAVGRDLRAITAMQQRFLDAQQEIEKSY